VEENEKRVYKKRIFNGGRWRRGARSSGSSGPRESIAPRIGYRANRATCRRVASVEERRGRTMRWHPNDVGFESTMAKSIQRIAESGPRALSHMEVLNSYWVGEDGMHKYFESLGGPQHPAIRNDPKIIGLRPANRGRFSGAHVRGKKGRGLHKREGRERTPEHQAAMVDGAKLIVTPTNPGRGT